MRLVTSRALSVKNYKKIRTLGSTKEYFRQAYFDLI